MSDLLAGSSVTAAAGLAVFRVASGTRGQVKPSAGTPSARDLLTGPAGGPPSARDLLPQVAELRAELHDLDEVVVAGPAPLVSAVTRSLGVPLTVLGLDPPRVRDAVSNADRLARALVVLTDDGDDLRPPFWAAHLAAGRTEAEAGRHFVAVTAQGSALEAAARDLGIVTLPDDPADGPFAASALVPAALAGADVAELLDQADRLAETLDAAAGANPVLALAESLAEALAAAPRPVRIRPDGTGFEGLEDWVAARLDGVTTTGDGAFMITYGGALRPDTVPGGGVVPDVAVNGPLGAQLLAWHYAIRAGISR